MNMLTETPQLFWPITSALWGIITTSLVGVIVHRTPTWFGLRENTEKLSLTERSSCNNCKRMLKFWEIIPVLGFFLAKGKCSSCGYKIPIEYPIIEALGGTLCFISTYATGNNINSVILCFIIPIMILIAWFDWNETYIPDIFVLVLAILSLVLNITLERNIFESIMNAAILAILIFASVSIPIYIKQRKETKIEELPWGDVTTGGTLGLILINTSTAHFLLLTGILHITLFLITKKGQNALKNKQPLPMAPALCTSAFIIFMADNVNIL
ncbi:MAG: prepilin peptidase [Brevinematales bacterium]